MVEILQLAQKFQMGPKKQHLYWLKDGRRDVPCSLTTAGAKL